jgi:hypothetical protein
LVKTRNKNSLHIYLLAENKEARLFLERHGAEDLGDGEGKER